eukprot:9479144-Pyramimonas_sp.AAC.1
MASGGLWGDRPLRREHRAGRSGVGPRSGRREPGALLRAYRGFEGDRGFPNTRLDKRFKLHSRLDPTGWSDERLRPPRLTHNPNPRARVGRRRRRRRRVGGRSRGGGRISALRLPPRAVLVLTASSAVLAAQRPLRGLTGAEGGVPRDLLRAGLGLGGLRFRGAVH